MNEPKPAFGEKIHVYYPAIRQRIGFTNGYDGRGEGPYLAWVTNDKGAGLMLAIFMPGAPPDCRRVRGKGENAKDEPYWDWIDPLQKARAVKRLEKETA